MLKEPCDAEKVVRGYRLPCGNCVGCRKARAREWMLRCRLELMEHDAACWATLTYSDEFLPPTLDKAALSGFMKRLRSRRGPCRFFASGEYGETFGRPHYHVILFGVSQGEDADIRACWNFGNVRVDPLSPASIAYVAGYTSKKLGQLREKLPPLCEAVDHTTGEVVEYRPQPPFVLMSRRPGIGGAARKHASSWKRSAVLDGVQLPVPRFLHEAWKREATDAEIEALADEKAALSVKTGRTRDVLARVERNLEADRVRSSHSRRLD